ncbi:hypothetical protein [Flavisphingomonas formosensis]|uniref:hypothetical protein n=1 Tax=Flavisphingomonas formosensis TaxID=861534 RepID=UPI0012FABE1A|nr:hypothetical protein [Sphingomonas formosensis]
MRLNMLPLALLLPLIPTPAFAYLGPGLGMGAVATALGVVVAVFLGLFSILWYPLKRLIRRLTGRGTVLKTERTVEAARDRGM